MDDYHLVPKAATMSEFWKKVDKTLRYHGKHTAIAVRGVWWDFKRLKADRPIFVVGCSRAGTTLVYKTLSESREIGTLQRETHDFWNDLHPLKERNWKSHTLPVNHATVAKDRDIVTRYFYSWTANVRFVDKNNQNGLCVPYLHALFPDAFFIFVKRSPGDNINSLIEGWGKPDEFAAWSKALPAKVRIDDGRYSKWCFFLPEGWREFVNGSIEDVCAFQYTSVNEAILNGKKNIPVNQWHEVFYEDLVRNPVAGFRPMFNICGLEFDSCVEQHCSEVLHIPYNAFSEIRLNKWKKSRNQKRIERVLPSISRIAGELGYSL